MSTVATPADGSAKLLDVGQVATLLNCSTRHIYRLSDAGKMPPPLRLNSLVRWSKAGIEEWVNAGCPSCRKGARR
ncbi:helix-turn-helix domain-containing protein [bacterium]|nr:helix-turn-helix domain-containing protein [bacterium]